MTNTFTRILLFMFVFGLLILPGYLAAKTKILEWIFGYIPVLSLLITYYMDGVERGNN